MIRLFNRWLGDNRFDRTVALVLMAILLAPLFAALVTGYWPWLLLYVLYFVVFLMAG